jgi:hypothetical protein
MTPDDVAAAYGHFIVIFTELDQYVTWALAELRKHSDPNATFESLPERGFEKRREALKKELKQFEGKSSVEFELQCARDALSRAKIVANWRNARVHCLIHRSNEGLALYDWKSRKHLSLTFEECQDQIRETNAIVFALKINGLHLSEHLDYEKRFDDQLSGNIG